MSVLAVILKLSWIIQSSFFSPLKVEVLDLSSSDVLAEARLSSSKCITVSRRLTGLAS